MVEGKYIPLVLLEELATWAVLSSVPLYTPKWALLPHLQTMEKVISQWWPSQ